MNNCPNMFNFNSLIILFALQFIFVMCEYKVEVVESSPVNNLGEGPHWDIDSQSLYYNDIYGGTIHRFDYAENQTYTASVEGEKVISFIIPVDNTTNEFAIGIGRRVGVVEWDGKSSTAKLIKIVDEVEKTEKYHTNRFNDAKADPTGRFYGGTMRLEECGDLFVNPNGSFYKYSKENGFEKLRENVGISNGLAWNAKINKFYYIDSIDLDVKEFDYDSKTGDISNEKLLIDFKNGGERPKFVPDGMTIDTDGNLFVALWGGSKVLKINTKTANIDLEINFPCNQVTSAAFGGPNLDILYVTTAATERDEPQPPPAGRLFKVTGLNTKGLPMSKAKF